MPKRPTFSHRDPEQKPAKIAVGSTSSVIEQIKLFFQNRRTQTIIAIVLMTTAVVMVLSYVSFLFTGKADESLIHDQMASAEHAKEIRNLLGIPGAKLGSFMINGSFGFVSIILAILAGFFSLKLLHLIKSQSSMRWLIGGSFALLWGSVVLGFVRNQLGQDSFIWWGGKYGGQMAANIESYMHITGALLLFSVTLVIFFILFDKRFIGKMRQWLLSLKQFFTKRPAEPAIKEASAEAENTTEIEIVDNQPVEIDLTPSGKEKETILVEDIDLTITTSEPGGETLLPTDLATETIKEVDDVIPVEDVETPSADGAFDIEINAVEPVDMAAETTNENLLEKLGPYDPRKDLENYKFPQLTLLKVYDNESAPVINQQEQQANANRIVTTLRNYGIEIDSIKATVGPTVTLYEVVPKAGIRIVKIQNLENDIMMSLSATGIRIIAPMPGKGTVGIEVPNENPQTVSMHSVVASKRFQEEKKMRLPIAIGRTITNDVFMFDLAKTPHLLVAGATGQGKSVAINAIITSLLYKKHPAELKLVLVDPKMVEFAPYKPLLRHYLAAMPETDPDKVIITDCSEVINTLNSLVIEMENRYKLLMDAGVRNLEDYNEKFVNRKLNPEKLVADSLHHQYLPYIVIVIDEYGDFIMQVGKQVETPIARITQKARAVGMHMILATQRPSVNIVTGVIKANIPTRIALRTQSVIDSRTVLDAKGADQLIGRGDMLYSGNGNITRIQCAFVDTPEVDNIVEHISSQQHYFAPYPLPEYVPEGSDGEAVAPGSVDMKHLDSMFADVARYVVSKQEGSTSRLQRAFEIGYNRAGKLSDQLEAAGIVGPNKGPKGRDVLIQDLDALENLLQQLGA